MPSQNRKLLEDSTLSKRKTKKKKTKKTPSKISIAWYTQNIAISNPDDITKIFLAILFSGQYRNKGFHCFQLLEHQS